MKAIALKQPGGTEQLIQIETQQPVPENNEVLIKVKAISINPVDIKTRSGKGVYGRIKTEDPLIIGWDISGIVETVGKNVTRFKAGDAVFGMVNFPGHGKAYAEYVAAPETQITLKPANISFEEAAASTQTALTAWQAFVHNAAIQPGQKILVHAAAGGVGHMAVQIAKYLGAHVTGTSSAKNKDFVLSLGADEHIDYQGYDWGGSPLRFDMVLDTVGGENIDYSIQVTKPGGTVISIPTGLNEEVTEKAKSKGINGYFILVQSSGEDMEQISSLLEKGKLKAHISETFDFQDMAKAHLQIETGRTIGKVVVVL